MDKNIINKILIESLGSFDKQYKISEELSNVIYQMFINGQEELLYQTNNNDLFKLVKIYLITDNGVSAISGRFIGANYKEKKIILSLYIDKFNRKYNEQKIKKRIKDVLVHELMHSNVFFKQRDNNVEYTEPPEYYGYALQMMQYIDNPNNITFQFAYSLYATYYQEVNAIVSQTYGQIHNILDYNKEYNNQDIINALESTESYEVYSTIIGCTIPKLTKMTEEQIQNFIVRPFNNIGFSINIDWVKRQIKRINKIASRALNNVIRNAMLEGKNVKNEIFI